MKILVFFGFRPFISTVFFYVTTSYENYQGMINEDPNQNF